MLIPASLLLSQDPKDLVSQGELLNGISSLLVGFSGLVFLLPPLTHRLPSPSEECKHRIPALQCWLWSCLAWMCLWAANYAIPGQSDNLWIAAGLTLLANLNAACQVICAAHIMHWKVLEVYKSTTSVIALAGLLAALQGTILIFTTDPAILRPLFTKWSVAISMFSSITLGVSTFHVFGSSLGLLFAILYAAMQPPVHQILYENGTAALQEGTLTALAFSKPVWVLVLCLGLGTTKPPGPTAVAPPTTAKISWRNTVLIVCGGNVIALLIAGCMLDIINVPAVGQVNIWNIIITTSIGGILKLLFDSIKGRIKNIPTSS